MRITARVRRAIDLMATGQSKTITETAEKVGMARESLGRALAKPHVIEHMRQRALRTIQMAAGRAAEVKAELLDRLPQRDGVNLMTARIVKETGRRVKRRGLHPKQTAEYGRPA